MTENETLRAKVLTQTNQVVADFTNILTNLHDRIIQGMYFRLCIIFINILL